ncbi:DinB family protein [Paenibacillus sp. BAC0078]
MADAYEVLTDQLLANANDPSWYMPFAEAVKDLSEEEATWTASEDSSSIAGLVHHLLYWNETWQTRYTAADVAAVPAVSDNADTFTVPHGLSWNELITRLTEVLLRWEQLLTQEQLDTAVKGFPADSRWWQVIANVATHNAYHIGQIVYIRKLQKSRRSF